MQPGSELYPSQQTLSACSETYMVSLKHEAVPWVTIPTGGAGVLVIQLLAANAATQGWAQLSLKKNLSVLDSLPKNISLT